MQLANHPRRRSGFTLVELFVVFGIIVVLIAITLPAISQIMQTQEGKRTERIISPVDSALLQHWKAVVDQAKGERIPDGVLDLAGRNMVPPAPRYEERARVIWIKLRLKQEFPMDFTEALFPWTGGGGYVTAANLPARASYVQALAPGPIAPPSITQPWWPSSACLYLILKQTRRGAGIDFDPDNLPAAALVGSTNNPAVKIIVDDGGVPLFFCRKPTGSEELNPTLPPVPDPRIGLRDPQDPEGLLNNPTWFADLRRATFELVCHPLLDFVLVPPPPQPRSFNLIPVIVSVGPDQELGLNLVTMAPAPPLNAANDNIYSFKLRRAGARGDQ